MWPAHGGGGGGGGGPWGGGGGGRGGGGGGRGRRRGRRRGRGLARRGRRGRRQREPGVGAGEAAQDARPAGAADLDLLGRGAGVLGGGGLQALDDPIRVDPTIPGATARQVIDEAMDEIVDHLLESRPRFDEICYSINRPDHGFQEKPSFMDFYMSRVIDDGLDASDGWHVCEQEYDKLFNDPKHQLIGMGVFCIGEDVRAYITRKLRAVPDAVHKTYCARRCA